ncbi:InlB B-repeat-containing protein, partial [Bifidobacterium myosotis]
MTGNTKVWRAPLAGLASVAMIATMGVAASTANAAPEYQYPDVKVTLDANGGTFNGSDGSFGFTVPGDVVNAATQTAESWSFSKDKSSVTVTDSRDSSTNGYKFADGVFPSLYGTFGNDAVIKYDSKGSRKFSGWYTEKSGGQAVDPKSVLADGTTLYAHWSVDTSAAPEVVTVNTNAVVAYDDVNNGPDSWSSVIKWVSGSNSYKIRLATGDTLADWELPSNDVVGDHRVFDETQWSPSSAKGGDTLDAKTVPGTTVRFNPTGADGSTYELYKDGVKVTANPFVDVKANGNLGDYQAVVGSGDHKLANAFTLTAGGNSQTVNDTYHLNEGITLNTANDLTLTPKGGQPSVVYVLHKKVYTTALTDAQQFFVPSGQSFQGFFGKTPDDVTRPNTTFLGWFDWKQTDKRGLQTNNNYFDYNLIQKDDEVAKVADPAPYDFTAPASDTDHVVNLYAGYKADAPYTTITLDPNYTGAEKISQKIYVGKTIAEQLPTVTRPGYTLVGWYNKPKLPTDDLTQDKLDTSKTATLGVPGFGTYYAAWTVDSLYGVNGLLSYLSRGYATKQDTTTGKLSFATPYGEPVKVRDPFKLGKKSGYTNAVKTSDGFTETNATSNFFLLAQPDGYNKASWKSFLATREKVVSDLKAELSLRKDDDIATVYKAAEGLTDAKADKFAQEFAGKLVTNTAYPDVNYDDYGTHSP